MLYCKSRGSFNDLFVSLQSLFLPVVIECSGLYIFDQSPRILSPVSHSSWAKAIFPHVQQQKHSNAVHRLQRPLTA